MVVVVTGQPGVGKTRLALALAHYFQEQDSPYFVLHTDILKVSLRQVGVNGLNGLSTQEDAPHRLSLMQPFLEHQERKARRDGYGLIIEGTLALGFQPELPAVCIELQAPKHVCQARVEHKHRSARQELGRVHSFERYQCLVSKHRSSSTHLMDANQEFSVLLKQAISIIQQVRGSHAL